ncbi:MAG TPA: hypothetical protein VNF47_28645 [Streptosporangiaceae bacterium]|nr:hypothetical protein [Streptosporangiaceae bacterium]
MTEQGYPPRQPDNAGRSGRPRVSHEPRRSGWQVLGAFDPSEPESDVPPWAIPGGIEPIRPARRPSAPRESEPAAEPDPPASAEVAGQGGRRRVGRSRAAQARRRRSKRRLSTWGSVAAVVVVIAGAVYFLDQPAPKTGGPITTLQKGEFRTVPDACRVLASTALRQYLAGVPKSFQPFSYPDDSQCSYTVDAKPTFRILNITVQADQPSLNVPGNGSATTNAVVTFAEQQQVLAKPPKHTPAPAASIRKIGGLGDQALSAVQVFHVGSVTDRVTVLARYRNVLITASLEGQVSGGFGPVSISELQAGAIAAARDLLAQVKAQPAIGA